MKKLPVGIHTFSELRQNNYVYVGKTGLAVELLSRYKYMVLYRLRKNTIMSPEYT